MRRRTNIGRVLQIASLVLLAGVVMRGHPPALGQVPFTLSGTDMVQNSEILSNKASVESLAIQVSKQNDSINAAMSTISGIQGEERGLAGVLVLLQIGQFVFRVKSNGAAKP